MPKIKNEYVQGDQKRGGKEICNNNTDDNQNGLIDYDDYECYFSNQNNDDCIPSNIVWCVNPAGLIWANIKTGDEQLVGNTGGRVFSDIAWSSDGKLYGIEQGLFEIDPHTSAIQKLGDIPGYSVSNSMTGDAQGNLYLVGITMFGERHILKVNPSDFKVTVVANLDNANLPGLQSAGDLTFLKGNLYLACGENIIAKIDPSTGKIIATRVVNPPQDVNGFGLVSLNDGNLYISGNKAIYQLDPVTMQVTSSPYFTFKYSQMEIYGLSTYTEVCNSIKCKAQVSISIESNRPFCTREGVWLKAIGSGITGESNYQWTLPNGSLVTNDSLWVNASGKYHVRYSTQPDTCGTETFIDINLLPTPEVSLSSDLVVCPGSQITLRPQKVQNSTSYLWQDGSVSPEKNIKSSGKYWLRAYNECGSSTDTIIIDPGFTPQVYLGVDTVICPGSVLSLGNYFAKQTTEKYTWSNTSTETSISTGSPGMYWLEVSNSCGRVKDSLFVTFKDSCSCFPVYPAADLGADQQMCEFETMVLQNSLHRNSFSYHWQDGRSDQRFIAEKPGIYWVDISTYCGTVRDSVMIMAKTDGCERMMYFPTAFTPNQDGKNDIFKPKIFGEVEEYELIIFNRWGQLVFHTRDVNKGWNGHFKGMRQKTDSFVWNCSYRFKRGEKIFKKGLLTLIR